MNERPEGCSLTDRLGDNDNPLGQSMYIFVVAGAGAQIRTELDKHLVGSLSESLGRRLLDFSANLENALIHSAGMNPAELG